MASIAAVSRLGAIDVSRVPIEERRILCRKSTLYWAANCAPGRIRPYTHTKIIDRALAKLQDPECPDRYLMISQPPRTGKTMMSILYGATKYLGEHPDHNIFVVTHNQRAADKFGKQARLIFETHAPDIFGLTVDPKSRANAHWGVKGYEGSFNAIGWGGPITGQKVHYLILDDLIKDSKEALSPNIRDDIWDWWDGTATQRIQDNAEVQTLVCSIQTRWHVDDLNGRLLAQERAGGAMRWKSCIFPALADKGDIYYDGELVMRLGESLCPDILPLSYLENVRKTKSRYWWECNYQQRPITQDGLLWSSDCFPNERFVDGWPARLMYLVVGVDPATGRALKDGDYSAIVALGLTYDGELYCEADLEKTGPEETSVRLARFCRRLPMSPDVIGIESNGFQLMMRTFAEQAMEAYDVEGTIEPYDTSERDVPIRKEDRIAELDPLIRSKDIRWVRSEGTQLLVSQLQNFPSQDHDDGPDALELASWILSNMH